MNILQEKLSIAFGTLPEVGGNKPVYRWGNQHHLIKVLELYQKADKSPYPLIYQVSNRSTHNDKRNEIDTRIELVIAVRNTKVDMLNENRWATTYKNALYPVVENIVTLFRKGNIFLFTDNQDYIIEEHPNYGSGIENFTIDHWDAIRFEANLTIYGDRCLQKTIKF